MTTADKHYEPREDTPEQVNEESGSREATMEPALIAGAPEGASEPAAQVQPAPKQSRKRAALLLIHGIGEQRPYQTLDAFARGLALGFGLQREEMAHKLVYVKNGSTGASRSFLRLQLPEEKALNRSEAREVDLHEFYWAGLVQGQIKVRQVLKWLAKTSLTPLRSWSRQPAVLFREDGARLRPGWIFLRELLRSFLLLAAGSLIVGLFLYSAYNAETLGDTGQELWGIVSGVEHPIWLASWVVIVVCALMILRGWLQLMTQRIRYATKLRSQERMEKTATRSWARASLITLVALGAAAMWVDGHFQLNTGLLAADVWAAIRPAPVAAIIGATAATVILRSFLVKYLGDVALYVTADERSSFFRTREEILERSTDLLRRLLKDVGYDAVYVAGHSLGSVIAYDTLNRVVREVRAEAGSSGQSEKMERGDWNRLRGLLTFGSPLDKVYYFFRTTVKDEEVIRAQVLSSLHGFRARESGRDYGNLEILVPKIPEPEQFRWCNVYSRSDPVSGHLDFYKVDRPQHRRIYNPFTAHNAYWNDQKFYQVVCDWL